jgi:hypothetical protein
MRSARDAWNWAKRKPLSARQERDEWEDYNDVETIEHRCISSEYDPDGLCGEYYPCCSTTQLSQIGKHFVCGRHIPNQLETTPEYWYRNY